MSLADEVSKAKQEIVKDGIDMSLGEIMRIYERKELIINPEYQRLFRWTESQKTRFIESLILGIPVPPIFVFTDEKGRWELIDGLQRLSTVFEYAGILRDIEGKTVTENFVPTGTKLLPSLNGVVWPSDNDSGDEGEGTEAEELPIPVRLDIERARIRVEILKRESDNRAKYELFQRLNTGGAKLSEQEVRNCVLVMLNKDFYAKIKDMSYYPSFVNTTNLTEKAQSEQKPLELVLRFLIYRYKNYNSSIDVHDWLDDTSVEIANDDTYNVDVEEDIFKRTFDALWEQCAENSFKRYDGTTFERGFLISAYETITHGVSKQIDLVESLPAGELNEKIKHMWADPRFSNNAKAGVRGTTRLGNLLPIAHEWFR